MKMATAVQLLRAFQFAHSLIIPRLWLLGGRYYEIVRSSVEEHSNVHITASQPRFAPRLDIAPFGVTTGSAAAVEKRCTSRIGKEMPTVFPKHPVTELSPGYITRSRCDGHNKLSSMA